MSPLWTANPLKNYVHRTKVVMVTVLQVLLVHGRQRERSLYSCRRRMSRMNVITLQFLLVWTGWVPHLCIEASWSAVELPCTDNWSQPWAWMWCHEQLMTPLSIENSLRSPGCAIFVGFNWQVRTCVFKTILPIWNQMADRLSKTF